MITLHCTTFGALPVGTKFRRRAWVRDFADCRRKKWVVQAFVKKTHGSEAGFADGLDGPDARFMHHDIVHVETSDIRLLVTIARHGATLAETKDHHADPS